MIQAKGWVTKFFSFELLLFGINPGESSLIHATFKQDAFDFNSMLTFF
jgi:hypothetical protein